MADYTARITWQREGAAFTDLRYPRRHTLAFDGGAVVTGSSSPHSVRVPYSDPAGVDPEEALVAAVSSCHMLWFLDFAARAGFTVEHYDDEARGTMGTLATGRTGIVRVMLQPRVRFAGDRRPDAAAHEHLHHQAHEACYIANSIRGEVVCEAQLAEG